ncbi:ribonuclease BN [Chitinophaga caeni]|uniref:Ribonuclease BN n=1 Tax=Chitinophaga caeni TaxID=2029983 RepID=A0A291R0Q0_9BACT|nr:ribonuclease BN [Chitinophaga caeni]
MRLFRFLKRFWQSLKLSFSSFMEDRVLKLSAALAYYTIFSIAPMLIIIIYLCDIFLGKEAIEGSIFSQIRSLVGDSAAMQIQEIIKNSSVSGDFNWAGIIGLVALIIGATGVFVEIQDSINFIWRLKAKPSKGKGLLKMLINRAQSFSLIVSLGFILLVSLALNGIMEVLNEQLLSFFPEAAVTFTYLANQGITLLIITLLFGIIFKVLPDAKIRWKDVAVGSITTALLFMLGKFAIGYYLGSSKIGSTYGAAGSIVLILSWVYFSAAILYFGAVFTRIYVEICGKHIKPNDYAVYVKRIEEEKTHPGDPEPIDS